jgi:DNA-binding NarL/FixJ family response regulator
MKNNDFSLLQVLYTDHLANIEGIHFISREIDVRACLLKARGTSKISFILEISSHTVITHVRNIMSKLEYSFSGRGYRFY